VNVDQLIEELAQWSKLGYGGDPVMLMNLNIQEHQELEEVNPLNIDGRTSIEFR